MAKPTYMRELCKRDKVRMKGWKLYLESNTEFQRRLKSLLCCACKKYRLDAVATTGCKASVKGVK